MRKYEKIIKVLGLIFLFFLARRGGNTKFKIAMIIIMSSNYYFYKIKEIDIIKKYIPLYVSSFLYLITLVISFLFSKNIMNERIIDFLGMSLFSIVLFLTIINLKFSKKEILSIFPILLVLSLGSIYNGVTDLITHYSELSWYRISGRTYTTIYAGELGIYFLMGCVSLTIFKKRWEKLLIILYVLIILILIIFTKSRNTMLMLPVTFGIIFLLRDKIKGIKNLLLMFFFSVFLIVNPFKLSFLSRLSSLNSIHKIEGAPRIAIFKQGIINAKDNLLLGEGFYKYKEMTLDLGNNVGHHPHYHNIFIETLATQGIITFIFYILFLSVLGFYLIKNYYIEKDLELKKVRLLSLAVFIFMTLYGLAEPIFYFTKIYMLLFIIISVNFWENKVD